MENLTLNDYQEGAASTAIFPLFFTPDNQPWYYDPEPFHKLIYPVLGLCGEAGEIANKVKKYARDQGGNISPDQLMQLADEFGDILWYISACATAIGIDLEEVASANLAKLADRKDRGVISGSGDNR